MAGENKKPYMQVLVCTRGAEGIQKVSRHNYPETEGVQYMIFWQIAENEDCQAPESLARRPDMKIHRHSGSGLSRNRNEALGHADATVALMADDDLNYSRDSLRRLMDYHQAHPEDDIVCGHITVGNETLPTWSTSKSSLSQLPRAYYFTSCEISFKLKPVIDSGVRFQELMGAGAPILPFGEEEVFVRSLLRKGLKGEIVPIIFADHPDITSGELQHKTDSFIMTRGALVRFMYPHWWPARLPVAAFLTSRHSRRNVFSTLRLLFEGAMYSRKEGMFKES